MRKQIVETLFWAGTPLSIASWLSQTHTIITLAIATITLVVSILVLEEKLEARKIRKKQNRNEKANHTANNKDS